MAYAEATSVAVDRSKAELERTLARYGADEFMQGKSGALALVGFRAQGRRVRLEARLPERAKFTAVRAFEQEERRVWRCLCLVIKAKLEAVESRIESFDEAFMPHIVMPDGSKFAEHAGPAIAHAIESGSMPLLGTGTKGGRA